MHSDARANLLHPRQTECLASLLYRHAVVLSHRSSTGSRAESTQRRAHLRGLLHVLPAYGSEDQIELIAAQRCVGAPNSRDRSVAFAAARLQSPTLVSASVAQQPSTMLRNSELRLSPALKAACLHPLRSRSLSTLPHPRPRGPVRRQNFLLSSGIGLGLVGLLGTTVYLYPSTPPSRVAAPSSAPLSALTPHGSTNTEHLRSLGIADLLRLYVVYFASSQDILVRHGPAILRGLQWTREVPLVGALVWATFEQVCPSLQ